MFCHLPGRLSGPSGAEVPSYGMFCHLLGLLSGPSAGASSYGMFCRLPGLLSGPSAGASSCGMFLQLREQVFRLPEPFTRFRGKFLRLRGKFLRFRGRPALLPSEFLRLHGYDPGLRAGGTVTSRHGGLRLGIGQCRDHVRGQRDEGGQAVPDRGAG